MMEKLSAKAFDLNYSEILKKVEAAAIKSNRKLKDIILLAATKTVDVETINYAINKGITYTGENRVQELLQKDAFLLPNHKHFIGHLQTNKVKEIINRVELIQSVDSIRLAKEISNQAKKNSKVMDILLEINIGNEESKYGFKTNELIDALNEITSLPNICVRGLMAIPPICNNSEENRKYFKEMKKLFIDIRNKKMDNSNIEFLSMGMSDDYETAIEEGANIVRIGTALFGKRDY